MRDAMNLFFRIIFRSKGPKEIAESIALLNAPPFTNPVPARIRQKVYDLKIRTGAALANLAQGLKTVPADSFRTGDKGAFYDEANTQLAVIVGEFSELLGEKIQSDMLDDAGRRVQYVEARRPTIIPPGPKLWDSPEQISVLRIAAAARRKVLIGKPDAFFMNATPRQLREYSDEIERIFQTPVPAQYQPFFLDVQLKVMSTIADFATMLSAPGVYGPKYGFDKVYTNVEKGMRQELRDNIRRIAAEYLQQFIDSLDRRAAAVSRKR